MSIRMNALWMRKYEWSRLRLTRSHQIICLPIRVPSLLLPDRGVITSLIPPSDQSTAAYLSFSVPPRLRLRLVRIICTASKLELFTGSLAEYQHVVLGENLNEDDDDDGIGIDLSVFELPLDERHVQQAALKVGCVLIRVHTNSSLTISGSQFFPVFTQSQTTFDIYEVELHLSTNAAVPQLTGAATSSINIENVQALLNASGRPLSASAEKFRQFLAGSQQSTTPPTLSAMMASIANNQSASALPETIPAGPNNEGAAMQATASMHPPVAADHLGPVFTVLRQYMDTQLGLLESRLTDRVASVESRLSTKLDCILSILQNRSEDCIELD